MSAAKAAMAVKVVFDFTINRHANRILWPETRTRVIDSRVKGFGRLNPSRVTRRSKADSFRVHTDGRFRRV